MSMTMTVPICINSYLHNDYQVQRFPISEIMINDY